MSLAQIKYLVDSFSVFVYHLSKKLALIIYTSTTKNRSFFFFCGKSLVNFTQHKIKSTVVQIVCQINKDHKKIKISASGRYTLFELQNESNQVYENRKKKMSQWIKVNPVQCHSMRIAQRKTESNSVQVQKTSAHKYGADSTTISYKFEWSMDVSLS